MLFDRYTRSFLIGFVGATLFLAALLYILETFFGIEAPKAGGIGALIGAVTYPAIKYAQNENKMPPSRLSWGYAAIWSGYIVLFGLILIGLLNVSNPQLFRGMTVGIWFLAFVIIFIIQVLVLRFSFSYFVKSQLKAIEKQKSK